MNRKTLEFLVQKGGLTAVFEAYKNAPSLDSIEDLASSLSGEMPFLILNFTKIRSRSEFPVKLQTLFEDLDFSTQKKLEAERQTSKILNADASFLDEQFDENKIRSFLKNLVFLRKIFPEILLVFDPQSLEKFKLVLPSCRVLLFDAANDEASDYFVEHIKDYANLNGLKIWFSKDQVPAILKKQFAESADFIPAKATSEEFAKHIKDLRKIQILKKNKPEGLAFNLSKLWLPIAAIFLLLPLCIPSQIGSSTTKLRDMRYDRNSLSEAPYFEYEFDGTESLRRIARYSVGRYHAVVTDAKMVQNYIKETLEKNELASDGDIPQAGTKIKFYPSENIGQAPDSVAVAWQYFTSMLNDSISYITELYSKQPTSTQRKHNGIDVAGKRGARILAPFAAKAWTFQDERGGVVLGLVQKEAVILFMHCDQLLYLDGQTVMAGDPVATVGVTGHTTGPHAHIVTGIVTPNGEKNIGGYRYKVVDPVTWYNKFFKSN